MTLKELIVSLCGLMSVSGNERRATSELDDLIGSVFDEHHVDALGNHLFVKHCGRPRAPKILVDTHFDEVGLMVSDILEGGFLSVMNVGGVDTRILPACEVIVYGKEPIFGVVSAKDPSVLSGKDAERLPTVQEVVIDTGYSKEELEELCPIGTPVGYKPVYRELMNDRLCGKAFDDKACGACAIFGIDAVKPSDLAGDVYFLFSSCEETGGAGAAVAGFGIRPDYAIVADVTHAAVPEVEDEPLLPFGCGVAIDISPLTDRRLTRKTVELCRSQGIPYGIEACPGSTGTNANATGTTAEGIPTVLVGIPITSMHSAAEVLCMEDARALSNVIKAFVRSREIAEVFAR